MTDGISSEILYEMDMVVNGELRKLEVAPDETLITVLRDKLNLRGTKFGCGSGECGACTVLCDGDPICSCITLAWKVENSTIETIEGLGDGRLTAVQEAFVEKGALQCGFCSPGMILAATALLRNVPNPSRDEVIHALQGNVCRCTGYVKIFDAVEAASRKRS